MAEPVPSLEEMARMRQAAVEELDKAREAVDDVKPIYELAIDWRSDAHDRVKLIDLAMDTAKREHAIRRALSEQAIDYAGPAVVVTERYSSFAGHPDPYLLVAVGPEGTGLYLLKPRRPGRWGGKAYARLQRDGDEPERFERMRDAGLVYWQERGRGEFGEGTGATKPKSPPEGGRWRWLKVREQEELTSG